MQYHISKRTRRGKVVLGLLVGAALSIFLVNNYFHHLRKFDDDATSSLTTAKPTKKNSHKAIADIGESKDASGNKIDHDDDSAQKEEKMVGQIRASEDDEDDSFTTVNVTETSSRANSARSASNSTTTDGVKPAKSVQYKLFTAFMLDRSKPVNKTYVDLSIRAWIQSVTFVGIDATIFHNLNSEFMRGLLVKYPTITEQKVAFPKLHPFAARWHVYLEYLNKLDLDYALFTDLTDVEFYKNPFEFMLSQPAVQLFVGDQVTRNYKDRYVSRLAKKCFQHFKNANNMPFWGKQVLNVGVLGGRVDALKLVIQKIISLLRQWERRKKCTFFGPDMLAGNIALYEVGQTHKIYHGSPWNAPFKKWVNPKNYYLGHKSYVSTRSRAGN
jgi:hypothetical protein